MINYNKIVQKAKKVFLQRNKSYGNSFEVIDLHTIVGLMIMKLNRIYKLGKKSKAKDELLDCINYSVIAFDKVENENRK
jgi:mevalonate kinase